MPRYLLDTNVLSEFRKPRPSPAVVAWARTISGADLLTSVVVVGEIVEGILALRGKDEPRAAVLQLWLTQVESSRTVLPVDREVIGAWAELRVAHGRSADFEDMLIAATAIAHGLIVVTRNLQHFRRWGVALLDPWTGHSIAAA